TKQGFATMKAPDVAVKVGTPTTLNSTLQVGGTTVEVEVKAAGTELQTMNATVGNTITGVALDSLPSLNRDIATFVELQPGVSPDGSVAGAVVDQSSFQLDGGNTINDMYGSMSIYTATFAGDPTCGVSNQSNAVAAGPTGVLPTPSDSVEEFKVNSANQTADFNSSSGAQVQVATRRGTNAFHGSIYDYYLDNKFSANTWDNNLTGTPVPNWHRSRFGFRVGGPMLPKMLGGRTYFFFNYEGYRWPNSQTWERIVPSAAMRVGLLTFGGTTYNLNPTPTTSNFEVVRLDHDFGDKWHFMASYRYFKDKIATHDQVDIGGLLPGDKLGVPTSKSTAPQVPWFYAVGLTTNISSNTTNEFHY